MHTHIHTNMLPIKWCISNNYLNMETSINESINQLFDVSEKSRRSVIIPLLICTIPTLKSIYEPWVLGHVCHFDT